MTEPATTRWNPRFDAVLALVWFGGAVWQLLAGHTTLGVALFALSLSWGANYAASRWPAPFLRAFSLILSLIGFGLLLWSA